MEGNVFKKFKKIIQLVLLLIVMFGVGFLIGKFGLGKDEQTVGDTNIPEEFDKVIEEEEYKISISNVEELLEKASELVTTKYFYKDADIYENYKEAFGKKIPFTTDKVVFTYEGTISVGIQLTEVEYEIDNEAKTITIIMPEIGVLANEIDPESFEYPYVADSIFNSTVMENYTGLIGELKMDKENEVMENTELLTAAEENAKNVLKNFLTSSDVTKDYKVEFK